MVGSEFMSDIVENIKCPKCWQNKVVCGYWNSGVSYKIIDNFIHKCRNPDCGYKTNKLGGEGRESPYEDTWPYCPFCGRKAGA